MRHLPFKICISPVSAIRFGRMPQAEKMKLKAESKVMEKEEANPMQADHKVLITQIHKAYMRNFNMNKAKARLILTGKTSKPVRANHFSTTLPCALTVYDVLMLDSLCHLSTCSPSSRSSFTTWRLSSWQRGRWRLIW